MLYLRHKEAYERKWYFVSLVLGYALWELSVWFMFAAGDYAESVPYTPSVHDLLLDNLQTVDMNSLSTYGIEWAIKITYFYTIIMLPKYVPFMFKAFAMFKVFRGVFISLLHMGHPFGMIPDGFDNAFAAHYLTKDLFFSGHTGYIFLSAFLFWSYKPIRYFFICLSLFIGSTTLFMHDHYTIDVLGALPITFTVYFISKELFKSDWLSQKDPDYQQPSFFSCSPYGNGERFDRNYL